jgi:translation initiation factor IF-3
MRSAEEKQLDLVCIAPEATPPVCRIMDYGKFRFEQAKKDKEARKNQKVITLKEIRLSVTIEKHDLEVKAKKADEFIVDGDKVKVSLRLRGREKAHPEIGLEVMKEFLQYTTSNYAIEKPARLEGMFVNMILSPKE